MYRRTFLNYSILYLPWVLSCLLYYSPTTSYFIAWLGSFWIFYISFSGKVKPLPDDLSISDQIMRPHLLPHLVFAGYTCLTSIFYFVDIAGYFNAHPSILNIDKQLASIAQCQRYYCLAHAAMAHGLLLFMRYPSHGRYKNKQTDFSGFLVKFCLVLLPLTVAAGFISGLGQYVQQLSSLSFIAAAMALAYAIIERGSLAMLIASVLFGLNLISAFQSGFKEPIILSFVVLGTFLYPHYKKTIIIVFIPLLLLLFMLLPIYNNVFRQKAWNEGSSTEEATDEALSKVLAYNSQNDESTVWTFLTGRLSEISLFTQYVATTPQPIPYYGFTLVEQSIEMMTPRILWPNKPFTEGLVMQRVYKAGVVSEDSVVSAKPQLVVDGYLSGGNIGVFITMFLFGCISQLIARRAEYLFGGYLLGSALMVAGLFQQVLWRGACFEFLFNALFWSLISLHIIFYIFKKTNIISEN